MADQKRKHSSELPLSLSKRGRPVKRVKFYRLYHGTVIKPINNLKWSEEMESSEAKNWYKAAVKEYQALKQTGAFQVIPHNQLPKGSKPMKSKFRFKKKFLLDGSLDKYSARCPVKGNTQRSGVDYKVIFEPKLRADIVVYK